MDVKLENLPDVVIHHIIATLPAVDAIKFSVLSKSLRSSWLSFPILNFDFDDEFDNGLVDFSDNFFEHNSSDYIYLMHRPRINKYAKFLSFIEKSLNVRCPHLQSSLQKLRFRYQESLFDNNDRLIFLLDNLVRFALKKNVKELDLEIGLTEPYFIDQGIFSLKSLTILRLKGIDLGVPDLVLTCPSLEFISIIACEGLEKIRISSSCKKLREIDIIRCIVLEGLQVQAENLECFSYYHDNLVKWEIDISACLFLRKLSLKKFDVSYKFFDQIIRFCHLEFLHLTCCEVPGRLNVLNPKLETLIIEHCASPESLILSSHSLASLVLIGLNIVTDEWVMNNISALSLLENLELSSCNSLKKMEFRNANLKTFTLKNCTNLKRAEIGARNMSSFSYCGSQRVDLVLITSTKCDVRILLNCEAKLSAQGMVQLRSFLMSFDHCKSLTLVCPSSEELIFPSDSALEIHSPLYYTKHLAVELTKFPRSKHDLTQLVESLLWIVPRPETITLVCASKKHTVKFCYSNEANRRDLLCCDMLDEKCWRHQTAKIEIQNFEEHYTSCLEKFFAGYI